MKQVNHIKVMKDSESKEYVGNIQKVRIFNLESKEAILDCTENEKAKYVPLIKKYQEFASGSFRANQIIRNSNIISEHYILNTIKYGYLVTYSQRNKFSAWMMIFKEYAKL